MVTLNLLFCLVNLWGQNSPTKMAISHYGEFCPHNVYQATHTFPLFLILTIVWCLEHSLTPTRGLWLLLTHSLHVLMQDRFHILKLIISGGNGDEPIGQMTNADDGVCGFESVVFLTLSSADCCLAAISYNFLREEDGKGTAVLGEGSVLDYKTSVFTCCIPCFSLSRPSPCSGISISYLIVKDCILHDPSWFLTTHTCHSSALITS